MIDLAEQYGIYLELNESSIRNFKNEFYYDKMCNWVRYAADRNVMFCLGSDAHYCENVGGFKNCLTILNRYNIGPERILNHICNEDKIRTFLNGE